METDVGALLDRETAAVDAAVRIQAAVMKRLEKTLRPDADFPSAPGIQAALVKNLFSDARKSLRAEARKARAKRIPKAKRHFEEADFWRLIEKVERRSRGDLQKACEAFDEALDALDDRSLIEAGRIFQDAMDRADTPALRAAASLISGGGSEDGFWDFRAGLVAMGRRVYEAALENPDTLAAIPDVEERVLFEGFQYVPETVREERGLEAAPRPRRKRGKGKAVDPVKSFPRLATRFA